MSDTKLRELVTKWRNAADFVRADEDKAGCIASTLADFLRERADELASILEGK